MNLRSLAYEANENVLTSPSRNKDCWRPGTPSPTQVLRLTNTAGDCCSQEAQPVRKRNPCNPHACKCPSFRAASSHSFIRAFSPSDRLSASYLAPGAFHPAGLSGDDREYPRSCVTFMAICHASLRLPTITLPTWPLQDFALRVTNPGQNDGGRFRSASRGNFLSPLFLRSHAVRCPSGLGMLARARLTSSSRLYPCCAPTRS